MKKVVFLISLIGLSIASANATHNRAGYISYTHISGLSYEVEITTYTVADSPAERPALTLEWGDGDMDTILRTNGGGNGVLLSNGTKENKYLAQHTFPSLGSYVLSMEDPNRNGGVLNVPNSINVPFSIQSELRITGSNGSNNSVRTSTSMNFDAAFGVPFSQNLAFYDLDADFLTFELATPRGADGKVISGYSVPNGVSVNPLNGDFVWNAPQQQGEYNFAILVKEFRTGELVGSVVVDFQVAVLPEVFIGVLGGTNAWPTNNVGDLALTVQPNEAIDLNLNYADANADSVSLNAYGEPFLLGNTSAFDLDSASINHEARNFRWTPSISNVRCAPYIVSFRGTSNGHLSTDVSLLIYVHDQSILSDPDCMVFAGIGEEELDGSARVNFFPNPFSETASVTFSSENVFDFTFEVFNGSGQLVHSESGSTQRTVELNEHFASGLYFYKASFSDGKIEQGKVVVQ